MIFMAAIAVLTIVSCRRPVTGVRVPAKRSDPASAPPSTRARTLRTPPSRSTNVKPRIVAFDVRAEHRLRACRAA